MISLDLMESNSNVVGKVYDGSHTAPKVFPTIRTITATSFKDNNDTYYFKTREMADLLNIKQPFQFNADIKRIMGDNVVLSGEQTESFRLESDTDKTTFIKAADLKAFLMQMPGTDLMRTNIINNLDIYM